ncbi:MAG: grasp-with-spasm system SPASM domain peptide maturase [Bacteroidales bacterium]|nr:grasp-with-spasm system SPASM domain peptide maturase [Bacteroidales bacterium]
MKDKIDSLYFLFWSNCIPVKGFQRSIVYDIFRGRYILTSNLFVDIYKEYSNYPIGKIKELTGHKYDRGIQKFYTFFVDNDYGIYTDMPETFPALSISHEMPYPITNALLDINTNDLKYDIFHVLEMLSDISVNAIEIRDYGNMNLNFIKQILNKTDKSSIEYIEIFTNYSKKNKKSSFFFLEKNNRIRNIFFYLSPYNDHIKFNEDNKANVVFSKKKIDYKNECGQITGLNFRVNNFLFTESCSYNNCLHKKISISSKGTFVNCPSLQQEFGNVNKMTSKDLLNIVNNNDFRKYWNISKDKIDVCKDCEYRYMCLDCRCFIKDPGNIYSQPAKCSYNPYICKWQGEEGYVPVEECGTYGKETGFVPDEIKIAKLNQKIWEE